MKAMLLSVLCDFRPAATAIGLGVNGIVAQGSEAGGHARGRIPLHALLRTIRQNWPELLLIAAGLFMLTASQSVAAQTLYYHGQMLDSSGNAVADPNGGVAFTINIYSNNGTCLIYIDRLSE